MRCILYSIKLYNCRLWYSPKVNVTDLVTAVHNYQVEVYTRDEPEGGTDANISITIDGLRGDTGRRRLLVSQNQQKFKPGQASHSNI